jgi:transcriptional regulator with XRE-family HTH domain
MAVSKAFQDRFTELVSDLEIKTKTEIASTINITYATFSKIYNYGIFPTVPILIRIADFFNVSIDYLIGNTDNDTFIKAERTKTFQERLYELRIESNIPTIYKLAELIHIHRNNIAQWNNHNSIPLIDDVELIADYFNVSIDYLLGRTDDRTLYK